MTASDFLRLFSDEAMNPPQDQNQAYLEELYKVTGITYGIQSLPDGSIRMNDGSIRRQGDQPFPVASDMSGGVRMSDGSVYRLSPEIARYMEGAPAVSQLLFNQQQPITQEYGATGMHPQGHLGVDFKTKDLQDKSYRLPFPVEVVEVNQDDGTGRGYGNSVLVKLPTGEMFRLSHMSQMGNLQPGQRLQPGELIGVAGSTGYSTAEHLDLEYYNRDGQRANPQEFSLTPELLQGMGMEQSQAPQPQASQGQVLGSQAQAQPEQPQQSSRFQSVIDRIQGGTQKAEEIGTKYNLPGLGVGEMGRGDVLGARTEQANTLAGLGTKLNAPELQTNELVKEQGTNPLRQLAGNLVDVASTPLKKIGMPDIGLSEKIAGGKTVNTDVNLAPGAFAYDSSGQQVGSKQPAPQDYANVLGQNVQDVAQAGKNIFMDTGEKVLGSASAGLEKLKGMFSRNNVQGRPNPSDLAGDRVVGASTNLLPVQDSASMMTSKPTQDTRDEFFKGDGSEKFASFIDQTKSDGRALNMGMFSPDFFHDKGRVGNVFGGTAMEGQAMGKFEAYEAQKRAEEEARRRAEEANRSAGGVSSGSNQNFTPSYANVQSGNTFSYAPKASSGGISSGPYQNYTPAKANYTSMSGAASYAPPPQQQPQQQSLFDRAKTAIAKLFRR
jgi:hypothetical protein